MCKLQETENAQKLKQAHYFDKRHRVKSLSRLDPGTEVQVSTYPEPGVILQETKSPRQYEVETTSGVIKRNRVQLVPLPPEGEPQGKEAGDNREIKESPKPDWNILSRPKRTVKLSLKARENRGLK